MASNQRRIKDLGLASLLSSSLRYPNWIFNERFSLQEMSKSIKALLALEVLYGTPFIWSVIAAGAGAIYYFALAFEPKWSAIFAELLISCGLSYLVRSKRWMFIISLYVLFASLGFAAGKFEDWRLSTTMLDAETSTTITGRVVSLERQANGSYRLILDVLASEKPKLERQPDRIRVSARTLPQGTVIGSGLKGFIRLRPPSGPVRSSSYDFSFYSYFQAIGAQGFFLGTPKIAAIPPPSSLSERFSLQTARLRGAMTQRIVSVIGGEQGAIAAALITGQRGGITEQTNEALRIAGLSHILSISGLHMAMVTGLVLVVMRFVFALFPVFSSRWPGKKLAALVALAVSAFYLLLSGADVAAQRSFVMVAVMLLAILCDRAAITMRNIAIAALISIIITPHELLGPSFQMSFSATAALVATFGWWTENRPNGNKNITAYFVGFGIVKKLTTPIISTAVASLVAGFGSGIFSAYHFSNTAPLGVISNALAFPVMSFSVMPFALLAAVLMPFGLDWTALKVMGFGVAIVQRIALWVASISPDLQPSAILPTAIILLSLGLATLLFMRTRLRFFGLLIMMIGFGVYHYQEVPLAIVAEDGKTVAAVYDDHRMAVNITRLNGFQLRNWQAAFGIKNVDMPVKNGNTLKGQTFTCNTIACSVLLGDGRKLTVLSMPLEKERICEASDVLVLNYVGAKNFCDSQQPLVITRRDLALKGTVEIMRNDKLSWAVGLPKRSWNNHRQFARNARG